MIDPSLKAALLAFTNDVSGGDQPLLETIRGFTETPSTTLEEIGFYGAEDASPDERAFRATVSALGQDGTMFEFEDKHIDEMPYLLVEEGWIEADTKQVEKFISDVGEAATTMDEPELTSYAMKEFPAHIATLERAIVASPYDILYVDVPLGDTFHILRVSPAIAAKWTNTLFLKTKTERFAVTAPQWNVYWSFLTSALQLDWRRENPVPSLDEAALVSLKDRGF